MTQKPTSSNAGLGSALGGRGGVDEVIRVFSSDRATDNAVENVEHRIDEPIGGLTPSQCAFRDEEEPEEDVEDRCDVVQRDVKHSVKAGGLPNVPEQKRISDADDEDVDRDGRHGGGSGEE